MVAKLEKGIWGRVLEHWDGLEPEAARGILQIKFAKPAIARMNKLAARARAGILTADERAELDFYNDFGRTIEILQSKARTTLKQRKASKR